MIDNYDSFTFNLVAALSRLGASVEVVVHDRADVDALMHASVDAYVVSPGPCAPEQSGVSLPLYREALLGRVARPILGVCLGHQTLAFAAGAKVIRAARPLHGKVDRIVHDGRGMFEGAPPELTMTRYNSLVVDEATLPETLAVAARSRSDGAVMALRHTSLPLESVQFHPESEWSEGGLELLRRWLKGLRAAR